VRDGACPEQVEGEAASSEGLGANRPISTILADAGTMEIFAIIFETLP